VSVKEVAAYTALSDLFEILIERMLCSHRL
jgi:hypothetical protein